MTQSAAVRFITPYREGDQGPDRVLVSRIEGMRSCRRCSRLHPYLVALTNPGDEAPAEDLLSDSWEDAAHRIRQWLADGPRFLGRREPDNEDDATELLFDNRTAAIQWLLEPV